MTPLFLLIGWLIICVVARRLGPIHIQVDDFGWLNTLFQRANKTQAKLGGIAWFWPFSIGSARSLRHETIHFNQQCELFVLPFFVLYGLFAAVLTLKHGRGMAAYKLNPFERAARAYDERPYSWVYYLKEP